MKKLHSLVLGLLPLTPVMPLMAEGGVQLLVDELRPHSTDAPFADDEIRQQREEGHFIWSCRTLLWLLNADPFPSPAMRLGRARQMRRLGAERRLADRYDRCDLGRRRRQIVAVRVDAFGALRSAER